MLDEDQDKSAMRNQTIAMILLMLLVVIWVNYFMPSPPRQPQQTPQTATTGTPGKENAAPTDIQTAEAPPATAATGAWPNLPPLPAKDATVPEVKIGDDDLVLVFTPVGARLKQAQILFHRSYQDDNIQLVPESPGVPDTDAIYPMGLRFTDPGIRDELDRRVWEVNVAPPSSADSEPKSVSFSITLPNVATIRKTFTLTDRPHVVDVHVDYQNLETTPRKLGMDQIPAYYLNWGPNVASNDLLKGVHQSIVWRTDGTETAVLTAKMTPDGDKPYTTTVQDTEWFAVRSAYFVVALKPENTDTEKVPGWAEGDVKHFRFGLAAPRFEIDPGKTKLEAFELYIGPNQVSQLKLAWPSLAHATRFFDYSFMDLFAKMLLAMLNFFYKIVPNYGVAIIVLTVLVRGAMFPLTLKQVKSMKRMQLLAPEMEKLKVKYKEDPQELQRQMMQMYKERGVNPLGGCLPMVLQLPVFLALYRMLWSSYELRGAPFALWIKDLSEPDKLLHLPFVAHLPLIGTLEYLNLLPLLCAVAMVLSTRLMPASPMQDPTQKTMMTIMPVFFSLICYSFASGLNLYILISTILGVAQSKFTRVAVTDVPEKVQPKKRQHWYNAAIAKRRAAEKDLKTSARESKENGKRKDPTRTGDSTPRDRRSKLQTR